MNRKTSVYMLRFEGDGLAFVTRAFSQRGYTVTGSGTDPFPYVMFRTTNDEQAIALANLFPSLKNRTLSTGQGTHTRTITLKENTMSTATKYDVYTTDGKFQGQRARKDAAIKLGEGLGEGYEVRSSKTGETVHTKLAEAKAPVAEAPAPADTTKEKPVTKTATKKAPAKKAAAKAPEPAVEDAGPSQDVEYAHLSKSYLKSAGLHGATVIGAVYDVTATMRGATVTLHGDPENTEAVAEHLDAAWAAAKEAFTPWSRTWRESVEGYEAADRATKNQMKFDAGTEYLTAFMSGYADAVAGSPKRKGGAYKDGVNAVLNPTEAPAEDDADSVI